MVMAYGYGSCFHKLCIGIGFIWAHGLGYLYIVKYDLLLSFYLPSLFCNRLGWGSLLQLSTLGIACSHYMRNDDVKEVGGS
jgi:hypothetical protein